MYGSAASHHRASRPLIARLWDGILRWLRVVWVCRVSAASAGFGVALFTLAGPARDLFMEIEDYWLYWTGFFALVLAWSLIVHYAARKVLEQQAWAAHGAPLPLDAPALAAAVERYRLPAAWVPRLLGLACLYAVFLGITGAAEDLAAARQALALPDPTRLLWLLAIVTAAYLAYLLLRRRVVSPEARGTSWPDYLSDFVTGEGGTLLIEPNPFWFVDLATRSRRRARWHAGAVTWDVVAVLLLVSLALVWIVAVVWPGLIEVVAPRALFVIVILALPVSLLAFLSVLSHRLRAPLILIVVVGLSVATGFVSTFHDLRPIEAHQVERRPVARLALKEAVDRWVRLNCGLPPDAEVKPCGARPVILASAGGASRAAFFTASVVGAILDDGRVDLRRRLFALSGVSGGSVGAAVIRAALDDAGADGVPPCRRYARSWFRFHDSRVDPASWRACLQALTAGDFLSRPVVGLAFRDLFGFPLHLLGMADRAVLLETAFEDHYRWMTNPDGAGLTRAVGEFPNGAQRWAPLLVLNTTSVLDGRRSIVSDLLTFRCDGDRATSYFPAAVDLLDTIGGARLCANGRPVPDAAGPAVRLSTGATASARFPVISPEAVLRDRGNAVDAVVDGGYFENDGVTSARQLAEAMLSVQPALPKPVILLVTNSPTSESTGEADVAPRSPREQHWYDSYAAPLLALAMTRDGHAAEAIKAAKASPAVAAVIAFQVSNEVPPRGPGGTCSLRGEAAATTKDAPHIRELSMSWWLSGAVQAYLDSQICESRNVAQYEDLVGRLGAP